MNMEEENTTAPTLTSTPATDVATDSAIEGDPPALTLLPGNEPPTPGVPVTMPTTVDATLTATPGQPKPLPDAAESPIIATHEVHDQPVEASSEPPVPTMPMVPIARLQGVQRKLSAAEAALQTAQATIEALNAQVAEANRVATSARIAEIRATHADIVPDLITGGTLAEVETSLQTSRRAFAAAQQAYARTIPTPVVLNATVGNPAQPTAQDQPSLSPLQMISAGLSQSKSDINK